MQLTAPQKSFFHTFGYLHCPALFAPDEIAWITREFETAMRLYGCGEAHDGSKRTMMGAPVERTERLCALLDDPRVLAVAGGVLGQDFNYASGDGNFYSGDTGWHPDGNWGQLFSCKIAFYLDPVGRDTGCLRVIPGSQRPDHFVRAEKIDPNQSLQLFGVPPAEFPGNVALESQPGDLVIFNHDLYHASFGGGTRRRMFTMNLTRHCATPPDLATLHQYLSVHSAGGYNVNLGAGMYTPLMVGTADAGRWIHLRQCSEIHDVMFPQFARRP